MVIFYNDVLKLDVVNCSRWFFMFSLNVCVWFVVMLFRL